MKRVRLIPLLLACLCLFSLCAMAIPADVARSTHKSCGHHEKYFVRTGTQDVYQPIDYDCPGSYITFVVYSCTFGDCNGQLYYDSETDFSHRVTHTYKNNVCTNCGYVKP